MHKGVASLGLRLCWLKAINLFSLDALISSYEYKPFQVQGWKWLNCEPWNEAHFCWWWSGHCANVMCFHFFSFICTLWLLCSQHNKDELSPKHRWPWTLILNSIAHTKLLALNLAHNKETFSPFFTDHHQCTAIIFSVEWMPRMKWIHTVDVHFALLV